MEEIIKRRLTESALRSAETGLNIMEPPTFPVVPDYELIGNQYCPIGNGRNYAYQCELLNNYIFWKKAFEKRKARLERMNAHRTLK